VVVVVVVLLLVLVVLVVLVVVVLLLVLGVPVVLVVVVVQVPLVQSIVVLGPWRFNGDKEIPWEKMGWNSGNVAGYVLIVIDISSEKVVNRHWSRSRGVRNYNAKK
jgi:hypothetical protein